MLLFDGERYRVRLNRAEGSDLVVVVFEPALPRPEVDRPFWGEEFFARRGVSAVGILPSRNDWYLHPEIEAAIAAILAATPDDIRVGYGPSMGGFGVLNHAEALGLARVVTAAPQGHPDPTRAKWMAGGTISVQPPAADDIVRIDKQRRPATGYIIFDPASADLHEAQSVLRHHALQPVIVPFSGHGPLRILSDMDLLEDALADMLRGRCDARALRQLARRRRKRIASYHHNAAYVLWGRNKLRAALHMMERARALSATPDFAIDRGLAELMLGFGRHAEAHAVLAGWRDHPVHGEAARQILPAPAPAAPAPISVAQPRCFGLAAGTRIRTAAGEVPIAALVEGELVATEDGALLPIRWIGKRRFDAEQARLRRHIRPVCLRRDSLRPGLPASDLWLGGDQLVVWDGAAVRAASLVNGATAFVAAAAHGAVPLFHLAFDVAATIFAEGVPVRATLTAPDLPLFANAAAAPAGIVLTDGATPPADQAPAIRDRMIEQAQNLGWLRTGDPDLHAEVAGLPVVRVGGTDRSVHVPLPAGATEVRLRSRIFVPCQSDPYSADDRALGVALRAISLQTPITRLDLPLDSEGHRGLHRLEAEGWRWTDGDATLVLPPAPAQATLEITLAMTGHYWVSPDQRKAIATPARAAPRPSRATLLSGEPHTPGHVYRVLHTAAALRRLGMATEVVSEAADVTDADLLIIWRAAMSPALAEAIGRVRGRGGTVLFDIDDLAFLPALARPDVVDAIRFQKLSPEDVAGHYERFRQTAIAADACLCTTEELAAHLRAQHCMAFVLPNGFDEAAHLLARRGVRSRAHRADGIHRIGYAGGTRTHQRDIRPAARALAQFLPRHPQWRLVLYRDHGEPVVDIRELPGLAACARQVEWRSLVPLEELPEEIARFDINIAPVQTGNPFCEAKSELKYFEAALAEVPTVASPTGPFRRAIRDGETGLLADDAAAWLDALTRLADDPALRRRLGRAAYHDVLWRYGPDAHAERLASILAELGHGRDAARAFAWRVAREAPPPPLPDEPPHETLFAHDRMRDAAATVIVPLYNYAQYVGEALDSVAAQTEEMLDLVVIDDASTDESRRVALAWAERHRQRFNRLLVLANVRNAGLGPTRNVGFAAAETPFVLPLDADNRLLPRCLAACLAAIRASGASYVYPGMRQFGVGDALMNRDRYTAPRFVGGNYVDALALIAKSAWAGVGGYRAVKYGWEDFDFWCRLAEAGLWGERVDELLAEYRTHEDSMLRTVTEIAENKTRLVADIAARHPWLRVRQVLDAAASVACVAATPPAPRPGNGAMPKQPTQRARRKPQRAPIDLAAD